MEVETSIPEDQEQLSFVIRATNVPPEFFQNRDITKKYFRRFGKVKIIMFKPKKSSIIIEYVNQDGMLNALEVGGEYNGKVFNISKDTSEIIKRKRAKKDQDPEWTIDPELHDELQAMSGQNPKTYNFRPQAMQIDPIETPQQIKPKIKRKVTPKVVKKNIKDTSNPSFDQYDLVNTLKHQALTVEDKFRILDARDKIIRNRLKSSETIKTAPTAGTCPDMCPEKERLMRETQHQVALYEQAEGGRGMNPKLAVKQYSRSSADQESPLPQELRPVSVLQMTMGYLLHRIMGLCDTNDVNLGEWYHFLWDRMRGIRKDITQQELCCQGSVELVEQCARFHIFCSARLVAEEPSVFDQKINTENLTKCLQTLKYMYHDLQLKGESCKNEPEFRAYIILLNLNDGNFMWEVQQLKDDIQKSKEVKFALQVYSALDNNNYVKFFKLVNSTTYLNASILMRYFMQVRLSALKVLLKCYSPRVSHALIPIQYLVNILAFEGPEAAVDFFEAYGLRTNIDNTRLMLKKEDFAQPELPYALERAVILVESKRQYSVGHIVCGKALPEKLYEQHVPQNSFDDNGYLKYLPELDGVDLGGKHEEIDLKDANSKETKITDDQEVKKNENQPEIFNQTTVFTPKQQNVSIFGSSVKNTIEKAPMLSSFWAPQVANNIFGSAVQPNIFGGETEKPEDLAKHKEMEELKRRLQELKRLEDKKLELQKQLEIEEARLKEEQKQKEELKRREAEEEKRRIEIQKQIELEKQKEIERKIEEKRQEKLELQRIEARKRQIQWEKQQIEIAEKRKRKEQEIRTGVQETIDNLLLKVEEHIQNEKIDKLRNKIRLKTVENCLKVWRDVTIKKRKRKAADFSPLFMANKSIEDEAQELKTDSQSLTLQNFKRYKTGHPVDILVKHKTKIPKIDLVQLTSSLLIKRTMELELKLVSEIFWKISISLPTEIAGLGQIEGVVNDFLQWKRRNHSTLLIEQSKNTRPVITYCLEKLKGDINVNKGDSNGFIFIDNEYNENLHRRICNNLRNFGVFVKLPVVLILNEYNNEESRLKLMIKEGIISNYLIIINETFNCYNLTNSIQEAFSFLATKIQKTPPLQMDTLKSFLSKYLVSNVWNRAKSFAKWNSNYKKCLKAPKIPIQIHNEALERLKRILLNESNQEHAKFPKIFQECLKNQIPDCLPCDFRYFPPFWNQPTYINHFETILNSFELPNFLETWPPKDELELEVGVAKYCSLLFRKPERVFYKFMSIVLKNIDPGVNFNDVVDVAWSDIVEMLVLEKLECTDFSLYGTGFVNGSVYNQVMTVYDVNMLDAYRNSDWFYINHPVIKHEVLEMLQETDDEIVENDLFENNVDIDELLEKAFQPKNSNASDSKNKVDECKKLLNELEDVLNVHKKILATSGTLLENMIK